ncbi:MAG: Glu-tRNA(Gln) amidotransferase GatDE subunit D, partial [Nitrosotalea sp.]
MSHFGYKGKGLEFLTNNKIEVGSQVKIHADSIYSGVVMPRYEHSDDHHIVLKLKSGYNIGLELDKIKKIELESAPVPKKENSYNSQANPKLP